MRTALPLLLLSVAGACSPSESRAAEVRAADGPLVVYAVNHPLACFAARIGGDAVRVEMPAPPDEDPAFWTPDVETVLGFQGADLILCNGAGYAAWVERVSLPASRTVDTTAAVQERLIAVEGDVTHTHGPQGEHEHGGLAFTTWLDPTLARAQAEAVLAALERERPGAAEGFRARFADLANALEALDARQAAAVARDPQRPLLGSHPVYQYLAGRYDLNLVSVHWEPDELPGAEAWEELVALLEEHPARWMLWEGEPLEETVERLRAMGVESVVYDPCGNAPEPGDLVTTMSANAAALERAFTE